MNNLVIASASRTAIGAYGGTSVPYAVPADRWGQRESISAA